jgi:hypothetical protein
VPDAKVLPVPVDRARLRHRRRTQVRTLYHSEAPAMLDRDGTRVLLDALAHVEADPRVVVRSGAVREPTTREVNGREVEFRPRVEDYWLAYPDEADALVLPRRYGGLSLPMQEAASTGMLVVATDARPQSQWLSRELLVPAKAGREACMKGGKVRVHEPSARGLATVLDRLCDASETEVGLLSDEVAAHAHEVSWDVLGPAWQEVLER